MGENEPTREPARWPESQDVAEEIDRLTALADHELPDPSKVDIDVWDDDSFDAVAKHIISADEWLAIKRHDGEYRRRHIKGSAVLDEQVLEPP